MNRKNLNQVKDELFSFVWEFKHGDNIMYNFKILRSLYKAKDADPDPNLLNKPISILIVSIIEAILVDFLARIDQATNHLPKGIDNQILTNIKSEIAKQKKQVKLEDEILGEQIYLKRKMYHYGEIIGIFKKYELFGEKDEIIYEQLYAFGEMRNRVHIENYHRKLEDREDLVFTVSRVEALEEVFRSLWSKMSVDFKRPW